VNHRAETEIKNKDGQFWCNKRQKWVKHRHTECRGLDFKFPNHNDHNDHQVNPFQKQGNEKSNYSDQQPQCTTCGCMGHQYSECPTYYSSLSQYNLYNNSKNNYYTPQFGNVMSTANACNFGFSGPPPPPLKHCIGYSVKHINHSKSFLPRH
jgi:hypothetical protein